MIAILGATGTIGLALARHYATVSRELVLFARRPEALVDEFGQAGISVRALDTFEADAFGLIVNAIGVGDPARVREIGGDILPLTQRWDTHVLRGLRPASAYVFISSGAVHEADGASQSPYIAAKRAAEARHREARQSHILDVRVFGFVDRTLPAGGTFFLAELARAVADRAPFVTSADDFTRDFTGAAELTQLVDCWRRAGAPNSALDLYSAAPLRKSELLREVRSRYGIDIKIGPLSVESPTGTKPAYASNDRAAAALGYAPRRTAMAIALDYLDRVAGGR